MGLYGSVLIKPRYGLGLVQEARHRPIYGRVRYVLCVGLRMIITVMMRVILFYRIRRLWY
ncbi:Uncharacterised protein [Shigella sonnei]|nr:Uncharacterised protein [Shigella sonnei]